MHVLRTVTAYPRESFGVFVLAVAALFAALGLVVTPSPPLSGPALASTPSLDAGRVPAGSPPAPEPLVFKNVAPEDARTINAVMPFSGLPNPPARALAVKFGDKMNEARALDCLTAAVYYEAAIEAPEGQKAVAQVVLNRLRHPAYPKSICDVVFQGSERTTGCQFTFTCDGALGRTPAPALWERARKIAWAALSGEVFAPVGWATHYHTDWVVPYWASSLAKASKVGTHIFYRWMGGWGRPPAFTGRYAGVEPAVGQLASLSGAHEDANDLAAAAGAALDELASKDEIVVEGTSAERVTAQLNKAAAKAPGVLVVAKPEEAKLPAELRWALTGVGAGAPEAALGPAAQPGSKPCAAPAKSTTVTVPGGKGEAATIKVRERCGT